MFNTAAELETARGDVEREYSEIRDAYEKQYEIDKRALEDQFHRDIQANERARRAALVAAGLNPDGSDPQGRPQGSIN